MHEDLSRVVYSEDEIQRRVRELGAELAREYAGVRPLIVGILKGSFFFLADLVRAMDAPVELRFLKASSYGAGTVTSGNVVIDIASDLQADISGRHVLVVDDIIDTGVTLRRIVDLLAEKNPASLKVCVLLTKTAARRAEVRHDYAGFVCPPEFLVGYGLDYAERYRNLPYIGVLRPEIYI